MLNQAFKPTSDSLQPTKSRYMIVFRTTTIGNADLRIAIIDDYRMADLIVRLVDSPGLATDDSTWYMSKTNVSGCMKAYFCSPGMAHISVSFTTNKELSGWTRQHPMQEKLKSFSGNQFRES